MYIYETTAKMRGQKLSFALLEDFSSFGIQGLLRTDGR